MYFEGITRTNISKAAFTGIYVIIKETLLQ
jgi:hypothetical protein